MNSFDVKKNRRTNVIISSSSVHPRRGLGIMYGLKTQNIDSPNGRMTSGIHPLDPLESITIISQIRRGRGELSTFWPSFPGAVVCVLELRFGGN